MTREELIERLEKLWRLRNQTLITHTVHAAAQTIADMVPDILAALRDDGWRTMESAPKQKGARFDVWCAFNPKRPQAPTGHIAGVRVASDGGLAYLNGSLWCALDSVATRWRPLPTPPDRAAKEEGT